MKLITINYAMVTGEEAYKGSIEPGKAADFAVLSADFLTADPGAMLTMTALATYVGGKQVYKDTAL